MNMDREKFEELKLQVYNLISNATKQHPIKSKQICNEVNLPFRTVKELISDLRNNYPIVSKETGDGGYWIAQTATDIVAFIKMIEARKQGYELTIEKMKNFLDNKFDTDNNHIPFID